MEIFFHIVFYCWGKENSSLYRGLRYVEVSYIEVPLYNYTHNCNDLEYTPSHTTFMLVFNIPVMKKTNKQKQTNRRGRNLVF